MKNALANRLLQALFTLWIFSFLFFSLQQWFTQYLAAYEICLSGAGAYCEFEKYIRTLRLEEPIAERYLRYMGHVLQGDFIYGLKRELPESSTVLGALGTTLKLAGLSTVIALLLAILMALWAHLKLLPRPTSRAGIENLPIVCLLASLLFIPLFPVAREWPIWPERVWLEGLTPILLPAFILAVIVIPKASSLLQHAFRRQTEPSVLRCGFSWGHYAPSGRTFARPQDIPASSLTVELNQSWFLIGILALEVFFDIPGIGGLAVQAFQQNDIPVLHTIGMCMIACLVLLNFTIGLATDLITRNFAHHGAISY